MTLDLLSADAWRLLSALFALAVLLTLSAGLVVHGGRVPLPWRVVLWAVVLEQAVIAYLEVERARSTPAGFPDTTVDIPLVGVTVSALLLLVACVGVFVAQHPGNRPSRDVRSSA